MVVDKEGKKMDVERITKIEKEKEKGKLDENRDGS